MLDYFQEEFDKKQLNNYHLGILVNNMATYLRQYDGKYQEMLEMGGKYLYQQSEYDTSIHVCDYILRFLKDDLEIVKVKYRKALNLKYTGDYEESIRVYREVQTICEKHPESLEFQKQLIPVLMGIGNTYHMLGEDAEKTGKEIGEKVGYIGSALEYYKKALHISKRTDGVCSVRCASIYDNMALMYGNIQQFGHAYTNSLLARKIFKRLRKEENFEMALCYINLGEILKLDSKMEKALEAYQEADRIKSKVLAPDHASHIFTYSNIGEVLVLMKRFDEAEEYLLRARDLACAKFSNKHTHITNINVQLKKIYAER